MAIAGDTLKKLIRKEVDKNIKKLEHDVDCIVKDIRAGRGGGLNIKKTVEFIEEAKKVTEDIEKGLDTAEKIRKTIDNARKSAEAGRKANVIASALNPVTAALGYAAEFIVKKFEEEETGLKNVTKVVPSIIENYRGFLIGSSTRIAAALAEKALKERVRKDRTNITG
tara:strand:+ start:2080 stop:2583 length:504 start_codon:yes stop_codon:yes gene_type:complete